MFQNVSLAENSKCDDFKCNFEVSKCGRYTCKIYEPTDDAKLEKIGQHLEGKTNDDVTKLLISNATCPTLPSKIGEIYKNIEELKIVNSGLTVLRSEDLAGLNKLEKFKSSDNPITHIPKDFFLGHSTLKKISFHNSKIESFYSEMFNQLLNLEKADFSGNTCVDLCAHNNEELITLKENMTKMCKVEYFVK